MDKIFNSSLGLKLNQSQVIKTIIDFINADSKRKYKIIIGTDSEKRPDNRADFVTAIVIHRVGNGGRYFWRGAELKNIHNLRDRITKEVLLSLETAKDLFLELKDFETVSFDFEIHADIGEKGETKSMIQEMVGMIRANNFEAKIKPYSYAASKVADRHV